MIFAAGLGTRLYPLTETKPKALVEYQGKTLLEHAILKVLGAGITHIVVNVHHFGEQIIDFINQHHFNAKIEVSDEREKLLDTAGGLKFSEHFFTHCDQILLYNVDVISSIDLKKFIANDEVIRQLDDEMMRRLDGKKINLRKSVSSASSACPKTTIAKLAVRTRQTSRYFLFEEPELRLCGWENRETKEQKICFEVEKATPLAFSGIHLVDKKIMDFIPKNEKLSFTPLYLELAKDHFIQGYLHDEDEWRDLGKFKDLKI